MDLLKNLDNMITAEDILIEKRVLLKTIEESGNFPLNLTRDTHIGSAKKIKQAMIEFAKYHVIEALKQALEDSPTGSSTDIPSYEEMKEAILNAYPLENIK